ncbi:MAG: hypothetical protein EBX40_06010, partial [Gammaproteobacteria bacterium]|nr:hypothetical protein [Gammaproteobacteria bacterium]
MKRDYSNQKNWKNDPETRSSAISRKLSARGKMYLALAALLTVIFIFSHFEHGHRSTLKAPTTVAQNASASVNTNTIDIP